MANMDQQETTDELEAKYYSIVPYVDNDPDFSWEVEEESSFSRKSPSSNSAEDQDQTKLPVSETTPKEAATSYSKLPATSFSTPTSAKSSRWDQQACSSGRSNTDEDEKFKEVVRRRRQLLSGQPEKKKKVPVQYPVEKKVPVQYPTDVYPNNWESFQITQKWLDSTPSPNRHQPKRRNEEAFSRRSISPSSGLTPIYNSPALGTRSCEGPCKRFKRGPGGDRISLGSTQIVPCYKGYQLLGDSQLVRLSEQLLGYRGTYTEDTHSRRIGYCVSGQKIKGLQERILSKELPLSDKLIMLIGTNDMVYRTNLESMCQDYLLILNALKENAERIVILTVPPVPKLAHDDFHMSKLKQFNEFLTGCGDDQKVFVVDLASLFISYSNTVSTQYFEKSYNTGRGPNARVDLIHLNRAGFKLLRFILDIGYFDK